ncbi:MAG TPA: response regulator [Verrucomicrobiae bacterium]|nr:response regulator [Verrucomicrobiae bacterium]
MAERILVVDDEKSIREALSKVLRAEHYDVLSAETGHDAMERYKTGRIDLLLLDLNLTGGNGWATLDWLARVNPLLPVVIITGRANQRALAEKSGADALMEKPLNVPLLLQTIRELLDEPMECRAARAKRRPSSFRFVSCDEQLLREELNERFTVPFLPRERAPQAGGRD